MRTTPLATYADINPSAGSFDRGSAELVAFIPMAAVSESGCLTAQERRPLSEVAKGYTCFKRGDVLLAKITPCMENGKAVHLDTLETDQGFGSTEFHVLRPKPGVSPRFLFHLVWNPRFRDEAAKHMTGSAGQKRVPANYLKTVQVPNVEPTEQRRIADLLDRADAIRRKREEALALTDALLRSTFLEMFGDPIVNPVGWPRVTLDSFATVTTGNTPPRGVAAHYGPGIEWIKSDNIVPGSLWLTPAAEHLTDSGRKVARTAPTGSTLMTCIAGSPESIGKVALADREVAFNQQINAVSPRPGVDHRYLFALLMAAKPLVQAASTNSMKGLVSKGRLQAIELPVAPRPDQHRFGSTFDRIVGVSVRSSAALRESEQLFASLCAAAFHEVA